jgi:integrase
VSAGTPGDKKASASPRISELIEAFLADRGKGRGLRDTTADGYRQFIQAFIAVMGDMRVGDVNYDQATKFRDRLLLYPKNRNKSIAYRDKTEAEISAMEIPAGDRLHGHTVDNHIGHLRVLFNWLENRRTIERNPFKGVAVAYSAEPYPAYSQSDLERIFSSPLWQPESSYARLATTTAANWWAPLLALYSGARQTELVQMRLHDISIDDGVLMASVVDDEAKGQQVKSEAGLRSFPVHPRLLQLGFSEYLDELRKAGADRVLQGVAVSGRLPGANLGKWWNERYRKINFPEFKEQRKVFYSFRHTYFTKALHDAEIKLEYVQQMCGHESSHMGATAHYDKGAGAARLFAEVRRVDFQCAALDALGDDWKRMPLYR